MGRVSGKVRCPGVSVSDRAPLSDLRPEALGPLRFGDLDDQVLLSNDVGQWILLDRPDFIRLVRGQLSAEHPRHAELVERGMLREGLDAHDLARRLRRKKAALGIGTHLHILVLTLRCNHACGYCHASHAGMAAQDLDMSAQTARRSVDLALQSPAGLITIELQGGEPLANWPVVVELIRYGRERSQALGRELRFNLVSNLSLMDEEKLQVLVAPDIGVCTSLDGPADLHDHNRRLVGGASSYAQVVHWLGRFRQAYADRGWDPRQFRVEALSTVTRASLGRVKDIVDTYLALGLPALHVRGLNPYGFAESAWARIGTSTDELLAFHGEVLDEILDRIRHGADLREQTAATFLTKLLTPDDPNHLDLRSPCGAGTGQLAYDYDGQVYTCDEGRMLARMGDPAFRLGDVEDAQMGELVGHPTVRAMAVASTLEALPGCNHCVYQPWCGVCPVHTWRTQGDLFGQRPRSELCKLHQGQIELLLRRLRDDPDGHTGRVFTRWTLNQPRTAPVSCSTT